MLEIIDDQDQSLELLDPTYKSPIPAKLQWRAWAADPEGLTGEPLSAFINDDPCLARTDLIAARAISVCPAPTASP